jgi:hypothetical protein
LYEADSEVSRLPLQSRGDDERHPVNHRAADEVDVARQAVQPGGGDRALGLLGGLQCGGELRAPVERVGSLAGLDLGELGNDGEALLLGEAGDGLALGIQAEAGATLLVETR